MTYVYIHEYACTYKVAMLLRAAFVLERIILLLASLHINVAIQWYYDSATAALRVFCISE